MKKFVYGILSIMSIVAVVFLNYKAVQEARPVVRRWWERAKNFKPVDVTVNGLGSVKSKVVKLATFRKSRSQEPTSASM